MGFPPSSILIGFSIINHPFLGTPTQVFTIVQWITGGTHLSDEVDRSSKEGPVFSMLRCAASPGRIIGCTPQKSKELIPAISIDLKGTYSWKDHHFWYPMWVFWRVLRCISNPENASEKGRWSIWAIRFLGPKTRFEDIVLQQSYTKKTEVRLYQYTEITWNHSITCHSSLIIEDTLFGCSQLSPKPRLMIMIYIYI